MDEKDLQKWVVGASSSVSHHRTPVIIAITAVVLIAGSIWGWESYSAARDQKALNALYVLEKKEAEKAPDLLDQYAKAVDEFGNVRKAAMLRVHYADLLMKAGKNAEAAEQYAKFLDDFGKDSPYRGLVLLQVAHAAAAQKDWTKAHAALTEAEGLTVNPQREFALYELGRVEEQLGQKDKARKHYETLLQDFADSPLAVLSRNRMAQLGETVVAR